MRVLLGGFMALGGSGLNASWEAVRRLDGVQASNNSVKLFATKLPMSYREAGTRLWSSVRVIHPDIIIAVGQARGYRAVTLERYAVNENNSERPDSEGIVHVGQRIVADGPERYRTTLPADAIIDAVGKAGIRAEASEKTDGFICNHVFYQLMHKIESTGSVMIGGLIRVPCFRGQVPQSTPSLPIDQLTEAIRTAAVVSAGTCPKA